MEQKGKLHGKKRYFLIFAGIAVLFILIYWADPTSIYNNFLEADKLWVLAAVLMNLVTTSLMLTRWFILYRAEAHDLRAIDSFKIYMIGQATNQVAPMGTGEITRGYIGSKYYKINFSKTLVSAVIERMVDILFFLVLTLICFAIIIPSQRFYLQMAVFIILTIVGLIFVLRPQTMDRLMQRLEKMFEKRGKFWATLSTKLMSSWETFKSSMYSYHERKLILFSTGALTVTIWSLDAVTQWFLFKAFDIYIPYYFVLGIVAASFIIGALSFLPGGLGAREGSFAYLTVLAIESLSLSVDNGAALGMSVALVYKGIVYLIIGLGAMISISTLKSIQDDKNTKKG